MSTNETPKNQKILQALAHAIHAGQLTNQGPVGLHHHTAATMLAKLQKLEGDPLAPAGSSANKGSQLVFRECVEAESDAESDRATLSDGAVKEWLTGYRSVLTIIHGRKASTGWEAAGFPPGKTAVPRGHDQRLTLLGAARAYLASHPGYETTLPRDPGPDLEITADAALALQTSLVTAGNLISARAAEQATCKNGRDADYRALFDEVSALINELRDLLSDDDPRWELFGLSIPANPTLPAAIATLTLTPSGTGRELATWSYAPRMESTRLFLKRTGVDPDFINIADPKDLEHLIKDLVPGAPIEVYVTAHNEAGDGPPSPIVAKNVGA